MLFKYEIITWQDNSDNRRVRIEEFDKTSDLLNFLIELNKNGDVIDSIKRMDINPKHLLNLI